ncbi:NAD(P)-binding protein [Luteolibacter marinus]|uniref:NAD(P)-binding protein n=1 Tax=Luteolibacter marinus TaxID=2776705 RepID=UPI00186927D4|nr:NAD(P)-binding protein [Luteolibacter marinus]
MKDSREHVVILGGGVGGCVAAYWLSANRRLRKNYRITLYQQGWRLGGKGASSRGDSEQHRSEEHGPHVWFGFYENAFKTLRGCMRKHAALGHTLGPFRTIKDIFMESHEGVFYHHDLKNDRWEPWKMELPRYAGEPGDPSPCPDVRSTLWRMADHLAMNLSKVGAFGPVVGTFLKIAEHFLRRQVAWKPPMTCPVGIQPGGPSGWASYLSQRLVDLAGSEKHWYGEPVIGRLLKWLLDYIGWRLRRMKKRNPTGNALRELCLADLYRTCLRGALVDLLLRDETFHQLDRHEFLAWLKIHGAACPSVTESPFLRGYYDTPFAFSKGNAHNTANANFAAGAALRGFFRIFFGYKGAYVHRMNLGMGECVFMPLYRILKAQGVHFEFFHRVEKLEPNQLGNRVARIRFNRQVRLRDGITEYDPVKEVAVPHGDQPPVFWPVWPEHPMADQLDPATLPSPGDPGLESHWSQHRTDTVEIADRNDPEAGELERFDHVILAIPPGAHADIAGPLLERDTRFRTMVETSESIRTIACQFWFNAGHGNWDGQEHFCELTMGGSGPDPFNIVIDASNILKTEATPGATHLLYLCGPASNDPGEPPAGSDPAYPARQKAIAKATSLDWLRKEAELWPGACIPGTTQLDPMTLYHPDPDATAQQRLDWQYFRMNIDPNERYVLSTDTSAPHRLYPWESGFNNLVFSGDWCRNSIDIGCVESATTSAMLAAQSISGYPTRDMLEGLQYE